MKLVFYSLFLNHHQAYVADEFFSILGKHYAFVELSGNYDSKGAMEDFSKRPYLVRAWEENSAFSKAMDLAISAEVCVFSGLEALPFIKARMKMGGLSFEMSERYLKRGLINLISPRIFKMVWAYHTGRWYTKNIYKLCCSSFTTIDDLRLGMYKGRHYKWGYFTSVGENFVETCSQDVSTKGKVHILWCARFLLLKHPELAIKLAARLKQDGYDFVIEMYGDESGKVLYDKSYSRSDLEKLIDELNVGDVVVLMGNRPNKEILNAMRGGDIFLFTSDKREGWGVVTNEAMSNGCVVVASDAIGSTGYLLKHKETGMIFNSCDIDSLYEQVKYLMDKPKERNRISMAARQVMVDVWNPANAANSLLRLIENLKKGIDDNISEGPCSKA